MMPQTEKESLIKKSYNKQKRRWQKKNKEFFIMNRKQRGRNATECARNGDND